jgi:hypothetical protein
VGVDRTIIGQPALSIPSSSAYYFGTNFAPQQCFVTKSRVVTEIGKVKNP